MLKVIHLLDNYTKSGKKMIGGGPSHVDSLIEGLPIYNSYVLSYEGIHANNRFHQFKKNSNKLFMAPFLDTNRYTFAKIVEEYMMYNAQHNFLSEKMFDILHLHGINLKKSDVQINRKMLAQMAVVDPGSFKKITSLVKS